ncbi:phenylacetate--CoA ligase family protein [Desulfonatronum lacustre]|uniref:phenylacetate--CoA ligase family protein n=1 Tax=Desulfonatronum lacustre TaxID=66849 RepID=UPI000490B795|nr:phenylacetate--CoA ligase family protein [Desulfonatronum lacustre]
MKTITLLTQLLKFKNDSKLTAQKVQELSRQRFTSLLETTYHASVFYRDLYSSHGIKPSDLRDITPKDLPIISRTMVLDNFDALITDPSITRKSVEEFLSNDTNPQNRFRGNTVMHTSGTTGVPGIFLYSKKEWSFIAALVVARISQPVFRPFNKLRLAFLGKTGGHYGGVTLTSDAPKLLYNTSFFNPEDIQSLISGLNEFQPDIISGYAGTIYQLALAKADGRLKIKPERLQSSGEVLTDNMRQAIERAFNQDVIDLYACCESIVMGIQKSGSEPFHLFNDWHHFEVIDEKDNLVPEGTQGSLLVTPLYKTLQPLTRYRLSDTMAIKTTEPFITLNRFSGRTGDTLTYIDPQGIKHTIHPYDMLAFYVPGLRQFQFEQTSPNTLLLRISVHDGYSDTKQVAEKKLQDILVKVNIQKFVTAKVELVETIGVNPKTGKFKTVIPYLSS